MRTVTLSIFSLVVLLAPAARGQDFDRPGPTPAPTPMAASRSAADDLAYEADIDFPEEQADPDDFVDDEELVQDQYVADNYDDGYDPQAYQQFQEELAPHGNLGRGPDLRPGLAAVDRGGRQ